MLHLKLHRLRRLLRRLQCTTRVQLPVSVSVYGNRGPLCLSLTAFALRLLGRNAPTTFSRRSHRAPARPASSSTSSSSSLLSSYCLVSFLLYCYTVCSAHTLRESAPAVVGTEKERERVRRVALLRSLPALPMPLLCSASAEANFARLFSFSLAFLFNFYF